MRVWAYVGVCGRVWTYVGVCERVWAHVCTYTILSAYIELFGKFQILSTQNFMYRMRHQNPDKSNNVFKQNVARA